MGRTAGQGGQARRSVCVVDVVFKDLCLDANRTDVVGPFWATLLGLTVERDDDGDCKLKADDPALTIWVNAVPEPLTVKNRVHLDVRVADPSDIRGAALLRAPHDEVRWHLWADPDGLAFCAFPPRDQAPFGVFELVVDAADPHAIASWWAARTGATVHQEEGKPWAWLEGVAGFPHPYWVFNSVPEPKTVKNRMHWDVTLADASVDDLVAAGASVVRAQDDEISWTVMADPEGNEFCVFAP
jgi:hypothetical protein